MRCWSCNRFLLADCLHVCQMCGADQKRDVSVPNEDMSEVDELVAEIGRRVRAEKEMSK